MLGDIRRKVVLRASAIILIGVAVPSLIFFLSMGALLPALAVTLGIFFSVLSILAS